ncbi:uncharacterized protein KIAA1755 homolog, partial [Xiphias gladius]|uniref:uncharacterized protein KIAA1755 homolog n=1 Tax=Xiphias gladius TaxID=8245 RepID=UPI001A9813B8
PASVSRADPGPLPDPSPDSDHGGWFSSARFFQGSVSQRDGELKCGNVFRTADSESLDRCIQTALSALYPPFQATSSTVLCQVLNVVENCYRGDGLRYLIHFLLPAKQFLQNLQKHACLQYCGLLFRHEGWPLCVHEKIVVQLCPLDQCLLRPGDFYLLVSPPAPLPPRAHSAPCRSSITSSPCLLLCSVSAGSHHVEQQEVSEIAPRSLFSMAWLDSVNREREQRGASRLERCLLSANGDVFRVPWEHLVYPQFISQPRTALKEDKESSVKDGDVLINTSHDLCRDTKSSTQEDVKPLPSAAKTNQSPVSSEAEDSEGEYVELTELPVPRFSPQKGSLTQSISLQHRARTSTQTSEHTAPTTHTHSTAHTSQNTNTLSAVSEHTPHNSHAHSAARAHTPETTIAHSSGPCVEVSSHIGLCSKLNKENLSQDSCGAVILSPISPTPTISSRAPPEVMETYSSQSGHRTTQEQKEGLRDELSPAQSEVSLSTGPSPTEPEQPAPSPKLDQSAAPTVPVQLAQSSQSSFYSVLLSSGAVCLPGTRDRGGRALLTVCTGSSVWSNPDCDQAQLLRLLLYYTSTLRKEVRALGLAVLVDARRAPPVPALFSALRSLQENIPGSIHTVLLLVNKESSLRLDKPAAIQVEVSSSLKSVQKHVELQKLPAEFGGSFSFSQSSWLCFRSRVEQLTNQCQDVINLLQKTINILQSTPLPAAAEDAELLLSRYKAVMRSILEDSRLVQLQQEGGASLSRLRREESSISGTEEYRAAVETVSSLYNQVDELLHRVVTLSNSRTQELNFIMDFRSLEQGFTEVRSWLEEVGEVGLKTLEEPEDSLELLSKKQQDFKDFYTTAYDYCKRGEALLGRLERWDDMSSADLHMYEVRVHSFWAQLQDFSQRVNTAGRNIDRAVRLYRFLDQAYGWALDGMRHLAGISMEECMLPDKCQAVIGCLEDYQGQHPPITDTRFQEMKAAAGELRGERGLRQWSFAWSKCQETKKMFDRKMEVALRTRDSAHRRRSESTHSRSSASSRKTFSGLWGFRETSSSSSCCPPEEDTATSSPPRNSSSLLSLTSSPITSTPAPSTCSPHTPQHTPLLRRLFRSVSSEESSDQVDVCFSSPSLPRLDSSASFIPSSACSSPSSSCSSRRQQFRKTQSFDCPSTPETSRYGPCPRALSEPVRRGNTGVFIRGLEVSSTEATDHTLCPRAAAQGWAGQGLRSPGTPSTSRTTGSPAAEPRPRGSKLRHIVEEMVTTEREYVRSLRYIIHHYFPEMDRVDLPQDLRGKRSVVFGNLEKLLDFHSQFFLRELEACWKHPLRVPHCFLRHCCSTSRSRPPSTADSSDTPRRRPAALKHKPQQLRRDPVNLTSLPNISWTKARLQLSLWRRVFDVSCLWRRKHL